MTKKIIGERLTPEILNNKYDCIIIGSGISGLTVASFLSQIGKKVIVLEKHYMIGGLTHTFYRKGYEWDVGLHYIGEVHNPDHPFRLFFDYISNGKLEWNSMGKEYDRIIFPDQEYSFVAGVENFISGLIKFFPNEEKAIREYIKIIKKISDYAVRYQMALTFPKLFSSFIGRQLKNPYEYYSQFTTYHFLKTLTQNEKLIGVLTGQFGDYGLPPKQSSFSIHAIVAYHYINGASYPVGGSSEIAKTIVEVINKNDGKVVFNADVEKIIVHEKRAVGVKLTSGEEIIAETIISSAGAHNTYNKLLNPTEIGIELFEQVKKIPGSTSALGIYLGLNNKPELLANQNSNLWIYPNYNHDENIKKYCENQQNPVPLTYISFPSIKDPTFTERLGNRSTISILGLAPYRWFNKWEETKWRRRGEDYEAYKEELAKPYLENLYQYLPQLRGQIDYYEISTPLSNKAFSNYQKGEVYGIEFSNKRINHKWLGVTTPIQNLYLTGQDSFSPGVCGALASGVLTTLAMFPGKTLAQIIKYKISRK